MELDAKVVADAPVVTEETAPNREMHPPPESALKSQSGTISYCFSCGPLLNLLPAGLASHDDLRERRLLGRLKIGGDLFRHASLPAKWNHRGEAVIYQPTPFRGDIIP